MFYLFGPEVGRRQDMMQYRKNKVGDVFEAEMVVNEKKYCINGDAAYQLCPWLQTALSLVNATSGKLAYNNAISAVIKAMG